jgi:hypothetical protein
MPTWQSTWSGEVDDSERQIAWDLPDENDVSGECLLTLDGRVWREELGRPHGVRITVTIERDDEAGPPPVVDLPEATLTEEQRAAAAPNTIDDNPGAQP